MNNPHDLRQMLVAMQNGELTVSRGIELLELWLAGNYSDDLLPPVRHGLGEDEMPWDRIDSLQARVKEQDAIIAEHNADMWVQGENYAVLSCQCAEAEARVKKLEAELLSALAQAEHNGNELAALRKKIEDAPSVMWHGEDRGLISRESLK